MIKKTKEQKGITLVALVITIIVLLILAGVTLSIVWNGGIIEKSANAVDKYENSSANETNQIEYMENMFDKFYHNATVRSGNSGGSSVGNTGTEWVIDTDYGDTGLSLGDLVKPKNLTGANAYLANEKFYVIGIGTESDPIITLLAEKNVKTNDATDTNNIQSASANMVKFNSSTDKGNTYATSDIKGLVDTYVSKLVAAGLTLEDVETVPEGTAVSGTKGRLMWGTSSVGTEVQNVYAMNVTGTNSITGPTILYGPIAGTTTKLWYWLGSSYAFSTNNVWYISGPYSSLQTDVVTGNYRCSTSYKSLSI